MKENASAQSYTGEELDDLFHSGVLERIGMGSRRICYKIPGTKFCIKCYRMDNEIKKGKYDGAKALAASVVREITKARFDEKRNTSCQEYRYWKKLREKLPPELFEVFPQTMECVLVPSRGWCVIEERVENYDGSNPKRFSEAYREADDDKKDKMLSALKSLVSDFVHYAVRFYDPQNLIVQNTADGGLYLRLVDFEPATRTLIPVDSLLLVLVRMKTKRRVSRWIREHLGLNGRLALPKKHRLSPKLRANWDKLIATEGAAMGLSDCSVFLENKIVNDVFYEGLFKGEPCVVKCSSRAPESIRNEYEILIKLYGLNSHVFPKPYNLYVSQNGKFAFVVVQKLYKLSERQLKNPADDIISIITTLHSARIVHRDVFIDNLMVGEDGHLKLIDMQFAIMRDRYEECRWMQKNWKYRYVTMGVVSGMPPGVWNDVVGMLGCVNSICPKEEVSRVVDELKKFEEISVFAPEIPKLDYIRLRCLLLRLNLQSVFLRDGKKKQALKRRIDRLLLMFGECNFSRSSIVDFKEKGVS